MSLKDRRVKSQEDEGKKRCFDVLREGAKIPDHNPGHQRRDYRSVRARADLDNRYELSLQRGAMPR